MRGRFAGWEFLFGLGVGACLMAAGVLVGLGVAP